MALKKPGIYDEFEYAGHWWSPENPERKVSGTLIFSKDGITLELIGTINGKSNWKEITEEHVGEFPILYGECEEGPVTLIKGFEVNKRTGYIITSILKFNKMIVGKHIDSVENLKLTNFSISLTNLESWLKYHPFEWGYTEETQLYKVRKQEIFEVFVEKIQATIKSNYHITTNDEMYKGVGYKYTPELKIISEEPKSLDWFEDIAFSLRNLLSILMDSAVFIESISFEEEIHRRIQIYSIPFRNYRKETIERFQRLNFDLPKIQSFIGELLNNWFETKVETSHENYIKNIFDSRSLILEDIFLNYAKALESFHRDNTIESGKFVGDEEYTEIVKKMISSIKEEAPTDLISKLQGTLKYANEFGFQRRIKEVIRMLPEPLDELVLAGQKLKDMADQIRNNRDYYTHFGEKPKDLYSMHQLLFINDRLKVIALYAFLKELGLPEDEIVKGILEDYYLIQRLQRAEEH
ncbi:HEPN domain-containing protein [Bacillus cereus]|uniref:ApeA N-terminal domain 1-containing protein n=1 Tax=Bacillus cereus TaxID=1396 RepID=UPI00301316BF